MSGVPLQASKQTFADWTYAVQQIWSLLDHLVGAREQCWWHFQAESLGGLEIDHQLELNRGLHGKIARDSSSDVSWTGASITSTPKDGAAALNGLSQNSRNDAIAGLNKAATRVTWGAISLSNSIHLPACVGSATAKPVALLPGRGSESPFRLFDTGQNRRTGTPVCLLGPYSWRLSCPWG